MGVQEDGRRRSFAGIRGWNARAGEWSRTHPWRYAAVYASAASVGPLVATLLGDSYGPGIPAAMWVTSFLVQRTLTKRRPAGPHWEPLMTRATDWTGRGDSGPFTGEDGRRWRAGI